MPNLNFSKFPHYFHVSNIRAWETITEVELYRTLEAVSGLELDFIEKATSIPERLF